MSTYALIRAGRVIDLTALVIDAAYLPPELSITRVPDGLTVYVGATATPTNTGQGWIFGTYVHTGYVLKYLRLLDIIARMTVAMQNKFWNELPSKTNLNRLMTIYGTDPLPIGGPVLAEFAQALVDAGDATSSQVPTLLANDPATPAFVM